ncbi:uncharacterized protein PAC_06598 [Phialocephala subalpina]|uniref:DUF7708 domain-containing protein n=1 Tax=Phialocephala subalpina TaxID=576137 RepID=A0A1L7WVB7_9HELO|nr:uncharacterized protein PAC_06598 [Phialocephala subalpina]
MSGDNFGPEITGIVRRYSAQVAETMPSNPLELAMVVREAEEQALDNQATVWRDWLRFDVRESDPDAVDLQIQAKEAAELWRKLKLNIEDVKTLDGGPPTVETLWETVHEAQGKWDTKKEKGFGKAKAQFFSFLETMDNHKFLFSVIPNGDKYTSLLTGVVSSIVKASVNYEQVADGFSRALGEISEDLNFVQRGTQISNTTEIKRHVVSLYREVFAFLCYAMKWYQSAWNRFQKSFHTKFYDKDVQQRVNTIKGLVKRVHDEMKLITDKTVQVIFTDQRNGFIETNTRINELGRNVGELHEELERILDRKFGQLANQFSLGQKMFMTLGANAQHELMDPRSRNLTIEGSHSRARSIMSISDLHSTTARHELEQFLPLLAPYTDDRKERLATDALPRTRSVLPGEVVTDIQRWIESQDSRLLWVEGLAYGPFQDELSLVGLRISAIAEEVQIPCISFFAKTKYTFQSEDMSMKEAGLVAMLYSLISQLIKIIWPTFEATEALTEDQFRQLDGTAKSIPKALEIFKALLPLAMPGLVCVIDGFERMDSREDVSLLVDVIKCLKDQPAERRVKVLFTTSGNCRPLSRATKVRERSDAKRMVQARGSSPLPGGVSAQDITMHVTQQ